MGVPGPILRFGVFEVDSASGELRKGGVKIKLQEQPFQVLIALLDRPGEVVTRDELQKRLWPRDTVTDFDRGLNKAISRVRDALGDNAANPRFIATLPQRGYRWLAPVDVRAVPLAPKPEPEIRPINTDMPATPVVESAIVSRQKRFARIWMVGALSSLLVLALGLWAHHWLTRRDDFRRLEMQGDFYVSRWTEAE